MVDRLSVSLSHEEPEKDRFKTMILFHTVLYWAYKQGWINEMQRDVFLIYRQQNHFDV